MTAGLIYIVLEQFDDKLDAGDADWILCRLILIGEVQTELASADVAFSVMDW